MLNKIRNIFNDSIKLKLFYRYLTRPSTEFVKQNLSGKLVVAEIGTERGYNALNLLYNLNIRKLYLIDPYISYPELKEKYNHQLNYRIAKSNLKKFRKKIVWLKMSSSTAVNFIKEPLDFVYIDGNHSYETVKEDIKNYYSLVRKGGVLGGDDFSGNYLGVVEAVLEFVREKGFQLYTKNHDWWIVK